MSTLDFEQGRAAERKRISAIVNCAEARGRESHAWSLALNSAVTVAEAQGLLSDLTPGAGKASGGRRAGTPRVSSEGIDAAEIYARRAAVQNRNN